MYMLIFIFLITFFLCIIALSIFLIIANCKFFTKAGQEGWKSLIPIYNSWILIKISGLKDLYFLLIIAPLICLIPFVNLLSPLSVIASSVATFFCYYNISKKLHQDLLFTILLFIFPTIMIPIIAFSKNYQFDHSVILSPHGPINNNSTSNNNYTTNNTTSNNYCSNCGTQLVLNTNYCPTCGKKIHEN